MSSSISISAKGCLHIGGKYTTLRFGSQAGKNREKAQDGLGNQPVLCLFSGMIPPRLNHGDLRHGFGDVPGNLGGSRA